MRAWRDNFTFKEAMQELQDDTRDKEWTVAILFSGGLLDTFAADRSGFTPIWGSETNHSQRRMWEKFTNCANIGVVFGSKVINQERPMYINLEHLALITQGVVSI